VLLTRDPRTALIVSGYVPGGVPVLVVTASVDDPEPMTELGENEAVAPDGRPVTLSATLPTKPFIAETVVVYDALSPVTTFVELGVPDTEKSVTVIVRVAAALAAPALSVTTSDAA
jgi:hypothetical protein